MNDYSFCIKFGEINTGWYVLDLWKDKVEFPDLKCMVTSLAPKWHPNAVLIGDKARGQSLIQELRASTRLAVIPVHPTVDKVERANLVTPLIESGRVYLAEGHPAPQREEQLRRTVGALARRKPQDGSRTPPQIIENSGIEFERPGCTLLRESRQYE